MKIVEFYDIFIVHNCTLSTYYYVPGLRIMNIFREPAFIIQYGDNPQVNNRMLYMQVLNLTFCSIAKLKFRNL